MLSILCKYPEPDLPVVIQNIALHVKFLLFVNMDKNNAKYKYKTINQKNQAK
jgi:hypothetical protein